MKHLQKDCKGHSTESKGQTLKLGQACQVTTVSPHDNPLTYLCSDSDGDEEVKRVTVEDTGSHPRYAEVSVQGVLLKGVVDIGSDLTIIGKEALTSGVNLP